MLRDDLVSLPEELHQLILTVLDPVSVTYLYCAYRCSKDDYIANRLYPYFIAALERCSAEQVMDLYIECLHSQDGFFYAEKILRPYFFDVLGKLNRHRIHDISEHIRVYKTMGETALSLGYRRLQKLATQFQDGSVCSPAYVSKGNIYPITHELKIGGHLFPARIKLASLLPAYFNLASADLPAVELIFTSASINFEGANLENSYLSAPIDSLPTLSDQPKLFTQRARLGNAGWVKDNEFVRLDLSRIADVLPRFGLTVDSIFLETSEVMAAVRTDQLDLLRLVISITNFQEALDAFDKLQIKYREHIGIKAEGLLRKIQVNAVLTFLRVRCMPGSERDWLYRNAYNHACFSRHRNNNRGSFMFFFKPDERTTSQQTLERCYREMNPSRRERLDAYSSGRDVSLSRGFVFS